MLRLLTASHYRLKFPQEVGHPALSPTAHFNKPKGCNTSNASEPTSS